MGLGAAQNGSTYTHTQPVVSGENIHSQAARNDTNRIAIFAAAAEMRNITAESATAHKKNRTAFVREGMQGFFNRWRNIFCCFGMKKAPSEINISAPILSVPLQGSDRQQRTADRLNNAYVAELMAMRVPEKPVMKITQAQLTQNVDKLINELIRRGPCEGLFRIPGRAEEITACEKMVYEKAITPQELHAIKDQHILANVLKKLIKEVSLFNDTDVKGITGNPNAFADILQERISALPREQRERVRNIITYIARCAADPQIAVMTQMNVTNMALMILPNLVDNISPLDLADFTKNKAIATACAKLLEEWPQQAGVRQDVAGDNSLDMMQASSKRLQPHADNPGLMDNLQSDDKENKKRLSADDSGYVSPVIDRDNSCAELQEAGTPFSEQLSTVLRILDNWGKPKNNRHPLSGVSGQATPAIDESAKYSGSPV